MGMDGASLHDLMRYAVTSQHLELVPWLMFAPRLCWFVCEALWQHVFNPPLLVSIKAFTILTLWAGGGEHVARLVAATAVNMPVTRRLKHAAAEAQYWAAC